MDFSEIFPGVTIWQFSPNGQFVALCNGNRIILKEVQSLQTIPFTHTQLETQIQQVEISPNSEFIAISWPRKPYIEIRKVDDQNWVARIEDNETIQWAPDSMQLLVVGEFNLKLSIYNLNNKSVTYMKNPKHISFSHCGRFMALSERKEAKDYVGIYATKDWKLLNYQSCDTLDCVGLAWSHNDSFIGIQDSELNCRLNIHCPCQGLQMKFEPYTYALGIKVSKFAHQSDLIAIGSHDEKIRLINLLTLRIVTELEHKQCKEALMYKEEEYQDQYTSRIVTKYNQVDYQIKSLKTGPTGVSLLEWSINDEYIASKNDNMPNLVFIWEVESLTLKSVLIQLQPVKCITWSAHSTVLAIASGTSKIFFWSPNSTSACDLPFDKSFNVVKLDWNNKSILLSNKMDVVLSYPQLEESF